MTRPNISFEFFPPRNIEASFQLHETVQALAPLGPDFVSVTYGAGGTTRALTHEAVTAISRTAGLRVAAHLTCVDASRAETLEIAARYAEAGITDIVALRGDMPGGGDFAPNAEGFANSVELIAALAQTGTFRQFVAAYPDPHPESRGAAEDIAWLKRKIDAGAQAAMTQFFFQPETFLRYRDACAAAGIAAPIIPGILPVVTWSGARRFANRCGVPIPPEIDAAYDAAARAGHDHEQALSVALTTRLCDRLIAEGVEHLHFYTLNRPQLTRDVCTALGVAPATALGQVA